MLALQAARPLLTGRQAGDVGVLLSRPRRRRRRRGPIGEQHAQWRVRLRHPRLQPQSNRAAPATCSSGSWRLPNAVRALGAPCAEDPANQQLLYTLVSYTLVDTWSSCLRADI